jgi:hypothetical protein
VDMPGGKRNCAPFRLCSSLLSLMSESALVALDDGKRCHKLIHHGAQLSDLLLRCRWLSGSGGHGNETGEGWLGISAVVVAMVVDSGYQDDMARAT